MVIALYLTLVEGDLHLVEIIMRTQGQKQNLGFS